MDATAKVVEPDAPNRAARLEAIMAEHETALLRYATRLVNNSHTAEDIVQSVFIKLARNWTEGMRPSGRLKNWLFRVTHNEAVDQIRRETRRRRLHEQHAEQRLVECPDGHNCPRVMDDRKGLVLEKLRKLHPREQQVILLRLEEGLSYREIGEITGRTTGNVSSIMHYAVRKLARYVQAEGGKAA